MWVGASLSEHHTQWDCIARCMCMLVCLQRRYIAKIYEYEGTHTYQICTRAKALQNSNAQCKLTQWTPPGCFLEMYFRGEVEFVGRENVKIIKKNCCYYGGYLIIYSPPKALKKSQDPSLSNSMPMNVTEDYSPCNSMPINLLSKRDILHL